MNDIGIGAVGAAIIAGLISLLGLVIGKEQKVSEFRQAWIDELRKCLVAYLANLNAIADALRVAAASGAKPSGVDQNYKLLNEANHGIRLRVNDEEEPSINLLKSMDEFEELASKNSQLTPENIRHVEDGFLRASKILLKFEWKRVKRGEKTYFLTKYAVVSLIGIMLLVFIYLWCNREPTEPEEKAKNAAENSLSATLICAGDPRSPKDPPQNHSRVTTQSGKIMHLSDKRSAATTALVCDPATEHKLINGTETAPQIEGAAGASRRTGTP